MKSIQAHIVAGLARFSRPHYRPQPNLEAQLETAERAQGIVTFTGAHFKAAPLLNPNANPVRRCEMPGGPPRAIRVQIAARPTGCKFQLLSFMSGSIHPNAGRQKPAGQAQCLCSPELLWICCRQPCC